MLAAIIILLVLALLLIAAELFVVGGVLGAMGVLLIFVAAGLSFYFYSMEAALVLLIVSFALAALVVIFGFRFLRNSRSGKHLFLADATSAREGFESMDNSLDSYRGKTGVTVSDLHPAGLAEIEGERMTVTTEGGFLEEGVPIEVVDIRYNQIVVRERTN